MRRMRRSRCRGAACQLSKPWDIDSSWMDVPMSRMWAGRRSCSSSHVHCSSPSMSTSGSKLGMYLSYPSMSSYGLSRSLVLYHLRSRRMTCSVWFGGPMRNALCTPCSGWARASVEGMPKNFRKCALATCFHGTSAPASFRPKSWSSHVATTGMASAKFLNASLRDRLAYAVSRSVQSPSKVQSPYTLSPSRIERSAPMLARVFQKLWSFVCELQLPTKIRLTTLVCLRSGAHLGGSHSGTGTGSLMTFFGIR
mmetsp:Transcript_67831/g.191213  ORF Transcript_67831/g.191213 Transcript_67831/m.191213 type:complete len:253 (-) Transcript_67831:225-983(-)